MSSAWYFPLAMTILCVSCILMGLIAAEDRPGFRDGRTDVKERWFVHSKRD